MKKNKYYFSFGCGYGLAGYYVIINAYNEINARTRMFELFGSHWCTSYSEERWIESDGKTSAEKWNWELFKEFDAHDYPENVD